MEKHQCKNCFKTYVITNDDFEFYQKIKTPAPTFCPDCRNQRRLVLRNELSLYPDKCDLCNKDIISQYSPDKPYKVYCYECFYSDKWDALDYGREYDFKKPFFEQFKELQIKVPRIYAFCTRNENSEYTNGSGYNKDCYMIFVSDHNENCMYSYSIFECKDSIDCLNSYRLESCFQCSGCNNCFDSKYLMDCANCHETQYSIDCKGCSNCWGCVGLRKKEFHFLNREYTKEQYERKIKYIKEEDLQKFEALKLKHNYIYMHGLKNENSTGDYIDNCKDCVSCYDSHYLEKCNYIIHGNKAKDAHDGYMIGDNTELMYETIGSLELYNTRYNFFLMSCSNTDYCDSCYSSKDIFGCISLGKGENCILNKQYSEKEYHQLRDKIIKQMTNQKEYGEFWPIKNSPFCYNETAAQDNFPLEKKDALALGYPWKDEEEKAVNKDLPVCESCGHNFNIIEREKKFYAEKDLDNPTECFKCRHRERLAKKNPRHLWHRQCECTKPDHDHSGRCSNEFETTYSPERKELIYCGKCYNKEVY